MLDQTTNRFWFLIGAVLIGASILFGANILFPSTFSSIGDSFQDLTGIIVIPEDDDETLQEYLVRTYVDADEMTGISWYHKQVVDGNYWISTPEELLPIRIEQFAEYFYDDDPRIKPMLENHFGRSLDGLSSQEVADMVFAEDEWQSNPVALYYMMGFDLIDFNTSYHPFREHIEPQGVLNDGDYTMTYEYTTKSSFYNGTEWPDNGHVYMEELILTFIDPDAYQARYDVAVDGYASIMPTTPTVAQIQEKKDWVKDSLDIYRIKYALMDHLSQEEVLAEITGGFESGQVRFRDADDVQYVVYYVVADSVEDAQMVGTFLKRQAKEMTGYPASERTYSYAFDGSIRAGGIQYNRYIERGYRGYLQ